jgi:hypothetical protein
MAGRKCPETELARCYIVREVLGESVRLEPSAIRPHCGAMSHALGEAIVRKEEVESFDGSYKNSEQHSCCEHEPSLG